MSITEKIKAIVTNQNALNAKAYAAEWLEKGRNEDFDYPMAGVQELAEFNNSFWMPWWSKENTKDMVNCRIELVDALHFMLSQAIIELGEEEAVNVIEKAFYNRDERHNSYSDKYVNRLSKRLIHRLTADSFDTLEAFTALFNLCQAIDFGFDSLVSLYMGKSALNQFRQDHGYKQKLYKKNWYLTPGESKVAKEDNYYLSMFVASAGAPSQDEVHTFLVQTYVQVLQAYAADTNA